MTTDTSKIIINYITKNIQASPKDLYTLLGISPRAIFKQLKTLCNKNLIQKVGQPPKVFYILASSMPEQTNWTIEQNLQKIIDERFYYVSPTGDEEQGLKGFEHWCQKQKLDVTKTAEEYVRTLKKYDAFKHNGRINGLQKLEGTFKNPALDGLFYLDFYAIERFGKTKLGQMLLLAKSNQDRAQITTLIDTISPSINALIKEFHIDGVGFIPPTVKRQIQLINELKKRLHLKPRLISIVKARAKIMVAQKTLNKLQDRIDNAAKTIIVEDKMPYKNILLIDDAVGSGATLHETAAQIKAKKICTGKIIGLAIVGSFKGFDVISEV